MNRSLLTSAALATLLVIVTVVAAAASEADLERHATFLASPELEGRLTGTDGARQAAAYIIRELEAIGLTPLPGRDSFELPFEFTAGTNDAGSTLTIASGGEEEVVSGTDSVQALSFSDSAGASGELVFAGYGLVVPEGQGFPYDSYATLDVEGKVVLVLRYFPEDVDQETRALLARYSGLRSKAMQARERGAAALLVVTGPRSPNAGEVVPMNFDTAISGSGIVAASISGAVADRLFEAVEGKSLEQAQKALDDGNPHVTGFDVPGIEVTVDAAVEREKRTGYNVVGMLPGSDVGPAEKDWVIVGAHYDHLGRGGSGNSLATKEEAGGVHHGADDNASGVAAALESARSLAGREMRRNVAVAFWSGEELGVLGSTHFVQNAALPAEEIAAYLNYDMVGRMRDNKLTLQSIGSSPVWPELIEQVNVPIGFQVETGEDPYVPTDALAFNQAGVPTVYFFTGSHEDYHRPSDTADKLNYEDMARVARFGALMVGKLADREGAPEFVKVEPKLQQGGDRDSVRAFTGTIPDYTTEVEGLRLSGVVGGGPADEAGLQEGDVIVEFAGQTITNIYDYTYALDAVKVDVPVQVVFERDGERIEVTMTPRARD